MQTASDRKRRSEGVGSLEAVDLYRGISRRGFLLAGAGAAVAFSVGGAVAAEPRMVVAHSDLAPYLVGAAVRELGGISKFVKPGAAVAIKPNFSWNCMPGQATNAANTNPDVIKAIVDLCLDAGASRISIVDNTLTDPPELGLRSSQIQGKLSTHRDVECKVLNEDGRFEPISVGTLGDLGFSRDVLDSDLFINVPKLKNHDQAVASISMKNLMGLIDDRGKLHDHGLHRPIAELNQFLIERLESAGQRQLVIVDGVRALETGGPGGPGKVVIPETVIAGHDPVDADSLAAELIGLSWSDVPHVRIAREDLGLGAGPGLDPVDLDVSSMAKEGLLPLISEPSDPGGSGLPGYLPIAGAAAVVCLAAGFLIYRRGAGGAGKTNRRRRSKIGP